MSWIQTLLGPLQAIPAFAEERLHLGNEERARQGRQAVIDALPEGWFTSAFLAKRVGRSPQSTRRYLAELVELGVLSFRASGVGRRREWRRIDAVPTVRREITGTEHSGSSENTTVSSVLVEVVVDRGASARFVKAEEMK